MQTLFLTLSGAGGLLIAATHGFIGATQILPRIGGLSPTLRRVNAAVFQLSTLYWACAGIALICAPFVLDPSGQSVVAMGAALIYAAAAGANLWATRGRHFGAYLFALVAAFALLGA